MKEVIVQEEIKVMKCDKCDEYGTILTLDYPEREDSSTYNRPCDCEYGQWMWKKRSEYIHSWR